MASWQQLLVAIVCHCNANGLTKVWRTLKTEVISNSLIFYFLNSAYGIKRISILIVTALLIERNDTVVKFLYISASFLWALLLILSILEFRTFISSRGMVDYYYDRNFICIIFLFIRSLLYSYQSFCIVNVYLEIKVLWIRCYFFIIGNAVHSTWLYQDASSVKFCLHTVFCKTNFGDRNQQLPSPSHMFFFFFMKHFYNVVCYREVGV